MVLHGFAKQIKHPEYQSSHRMAVGKDENSKIILKGGYKYDNKSDSLLVFAREQEG